MPDSFDKKIYTRVSLSRGWDIFFYLSLLAFFLSAAGSGGLLLLNRTQEETKSQILKEIEQKEAELKRGTVSQIFLLEQRLKNLRTLLSGHVFASNALKLVESDTLPQVRFLNFNLGGDGRKLGMTGEAASFLVLARQIGVLENDPQIEKVEFGGLSSTAGNFVGFGLSLQLKPTLLQMRP